MSRIKRVSRKLLEKNGNPDVRQQSDDKRDVTDILINGNWVELMIGVPM